MRKPNMSYSSFTSYRLKHKIEPSHESPYQTGIYTHTLGEDAVIVSYDYKKKDSLYTKLAHDANMLKLIGEKQTKYKSFIASVPRHLAVIDKSQRLITIRAFVEGAILKTATQGAKSRAYIECVNELERVTKSLTGEELQSMPRITEQDMSRLFFRYLLHALVTRPDSIKQLAKLAYCFYTNAPNKSVQKEHIAHRALASTNIVIGPEHIYMAQFRESVIAPAGTDIALFPQLYYREVGSDTMQAYLDEACNTAEKKRRFLHLSAFYSLQSNDETYIRVLAESIAPYAARVGAGHDARRGSLTLAIDPKSV
ncbi:hypothetical protein HYS00_05210 [Candidatus Microgenomates bacterium]|nr:hypothetical protein [Candidatus Microgenomates bacterium]